MVSKGFDPHLLVCMFQGHMGSIPAESCRSREGAEKKMFCAGPVPCGCNCGSGSFSQRYCCQGKVKICIDMAVLLISFISLSLLPLMSRHENRTTTRRDEQIFEKNPK